MTITGSGALSTSKTRGVNTNIGGELGFKGSNLPIIGDNTSCRLAGVTAASPLIMPTDFYGESDFKYIGSTSFSSYPSTTHTFSNFSSGVHFDHKRIFIFFEFVNKVSADTSGWNWNIPGPMTNITSVDGNSFQAMSTNHYQGGAGNTLLSGSAIHVFKPVGTNTTHTITVTTAKGTQIRLHVCTFTATGTGNGAGEGRDGLRSSPNGYNDSSAGMSTVAAATWAVGDHLILAAACNNGAGAPVLNSPGGWNVHINTTHSTVYSVGLWSLSNFTGSGTSALSISSTGAVCRGTLNCNVYM